MDTDKLLERVRKLYAMSQDTSSPNEAAIAAKRARSLMDEHGFSLDDLQADNHDFGVSVGHESFKKVPSWYGVLAVGVAVYNDCTAENNGITVVFKGFDVDAQSSALMLDYLVQAMERQLKQADKSGNARQFNSAFRKGFSSDMQQRLYQLADQREKASQIDTTTGTALVVVKKQLVAEHFGIVRYKRSSRSSTGANVDGYMQGKAASQRTSINSQIGGSSRAALH